MTSPEAELRRVWHRVVGPGHDTPLEALLGRHREPHRRYHTATHVMWVCRHVDELVAEQPVELPVTDTPSVLAAALFHDAVYDPTSSTNEAASAALAARVLDDIGWAPERCAEAARLVELTATHHTTAADTAGAVLLDADLAILGADAGAYAAYLTGVRAEYGHVDDPAWRVGRAAVIDHFLSRDAIYATPTMRRQREHRARANLSAELAALV
jgi:predicted metal-dependent HD superfamily phosphohydrolase